MQTEGVYFGTPRTSSLHLFGFIKKIPFTRADWKCDKGNLHMFCYFHLLIHADKGELLKISVVANLLTKWTCFQFYFKWEIITHNVHKTLLFSSFITIKDCEWCNVNNCEESCTGWQKQIKAWRMTHKCSWLSTSTADYGFKLRMTSAALQIPLQLFAAFAFT